MLRQHTRQLGPISYNVLAMRDGSLFGRLFQQQDGPGKDTGHLERVRL
jgi:hypothetical protein